MKKHWPLVLLVLVNLIIGLITLPGYGESTDELSQSSYAERTIQAVKTLAQSGKFSAYFTEEEPKQGSHGPAFIMVVVMLRNLFLPDGTRIESLQFIHFLYFLMFEVGVVSIYFLALRWVHQTAAFGTALLFSTQPILYGHAFINPKDVVFMSLLTASAALGFWMLDRGDERFRSSGSRLWGGVRSFFRQFLYGEVWLAGILLGFTSAIRVAAPLVGVVLLAYILLSRKWNLLPRFLAYGLIAFCFMILFWPYLWPEPFGRLAGSILNSAQYPDVHITLFKGILVESKNVPISYLPILLAVQLTEPVLLLLFVGAVIGLKRRPWDLIALVAIWFVLPAVAVLLKQVSLYDNLRQVFFILPPLFLLAALGLDWLLSLTHRRVIHLAILFLIVLPGLYADIRLYPYQYVYYNNLVGGLPGAYRTFELDYWDLAFKEAQSFLNQTAEPNADIYVGDSKPSAQTFARPDLVFNALGSRNRKNYDYIIVTTAQNSDERYSEFPTVFAVERDGVPLILVKKTH
ncbi:MAG: hypothetical protein ACM3XO_26740 [Bacteroidota bacterium]